MKKLCEFIIAITVMVSPIISNYCKLIFFEEEIPDGLNNFITRK